MVNALMRIPFLFGMGGKMVVNNADARRVNNRVNGVKHQAARSVGSFRNNSMPVMRGSFGYKKWAVRRGQVCEAVGTVVSGDKSWVPEGAGGVWYDATNLVRMVVSAGGADALAAEPFCLFTRVSGFPLRADSFVLGQQDVTEFLLTALTAAPGGVTRAHAKKTLKMLAVLKNAEEGRETKQREAQAKLAVTTSAVAVAESSAARDPPAAGSRSASLRRIVGLQQADVARQQKWIAILQAEAEAQLRGIAKLQEEAEEKIQQEVQIQQEFQVQANSMQAEEMDEIPQFFAQRAGPGHASGGPGADSHGSFSLEQDREADQMAEQYFASLNQELQASDREADAQMAQQMLAHLQQVLSDLESKQRAAQAELEAFTSAAPTPQAPNMNVLGMEREAADEAVTQQLIANLNVLKANASRLASEAEEVRALGSEVEEVVLCATSSQVGGHQFGQKFQFGSNGTSCSHAAAVVLSEEREQIPVGLFEKVVSVQTVVEAKDREADAVLDQEAASVLRAVDSGSRRFVQELNAFWARLDAHWKHFDVPGAGAALETLHRMASMSGASACFSKSKPAVEQLRSDFQHLESEVQDVREKHNQQVEWPLSFEDPHHLPAHNTVATPRRAAETARVAAAASSTLLNLQRRLQQADYAYTALLERLAGAVQFSETCIQEYEVDFRAKIEGMRTRILSRASLNSAAMNALLARVARSTNESAQNRREYERRLMSAHFESTSALSQDLEAGVGRWWSEVAALEAQYTSDQAGTRAPRREAIVLDKSDIAARLGALHGQAAEIEARAAAVEARVRALLQ